MSKVNIVYWEEEGGWVGHLQEYPDYWTQGESLDDLRGASQGDVQRSHRRPESRPPDRSPGLEEPLTAQ